MKKVLIIARGDDPHAEAVKNLIPNTSFLLDTNDFICDFVVGSEIRIRNSLGEEIDGKDIKLVFLRDPRGVFIPTVEKPANELLMEEWHNRQLQQLIMGLYYALGSSVYWVNSPVSIFEASNKFRQLLIAKKVGFEVLPTLSSSNLETVSNFAKENGQIILKATSPAFQIVGGKLRKIPTTPYTGRLPGDILKANVLFQKALSESSVLRVYVAGSVVVGIRVAPDGVPVQIVDDIPGGLYGKIIDYMNAINLEMGVIEFLEVDDHIFFMEVNTVPNWLWIEKKLNSNIITKTIATQLKN